jgi:hypothetical protein
VIGEDSGEHGSVEQSRHDHQADHSTLKIEFKSFKRKTFEFKFAMMKRLNVLKKVKTISRRTTIDSK